MIFALTRAQQTHSTIFILNYNLKVDYKRANVCNLVIIRICKRVYAAKVSDAIAVFYKPHWAQVSTKYLNI